MTLDAWGETVRRRLTGSRLMSLSRTLDMTEYHFDVPDAGEIHLHVQCPCRIRAGDQVFLGSDDLFARREGVEQTYFDLRVGRLNQMLGYGTATVEEVVLGPAGALSVVCARGLVVEVLPTTGRRQESWRLFRSGDVEHTVYPSERF